LLNVFYNRWAGGAAAPTNFIYLPLIMR